MFLRKMDFFIFERKMSKEEPEEPSLVIDATGQSCPIPSMRARLGIYKIAPGEILKVITTVPHSLKSIPRWCKNFGHELLSLEEKDGVNTFLIRRKQ